MKTLLVTNDFPPVTSGISTVFYYVWRYLSAEKNIILAPRVNDSLAFDKRNSLHVVRYPFFTSSHTLVKVINNLCMLLSIGIFIPRVDAIHCGQILSSGICGLMFKKLVRTPYFLWVYGGETTSVYTKSSSKRLLVKKIIDSADIIVTNSKFTSREFLEYGIPEEKIIEIIPAVDSDMFVPLPKPADLMEKHKLHGKMTVLTVSRLVERKGHDTILKALPQVLEAIPNLHYIIVGDGPDRENLKTLSKRLNLYTHVTFAGQVPDEALVKYYNLCDVFVMPNREVFNSTDSIEGFGITFIEANACGKPVIGGLSGGAVEAINDGVSGFLVDPLDKDKVAEKMIYLLQNVDAAGKIGKAGRKRAEEEFSWETRARELSVQLKTKLSMTN